MKIDKLIDRFVDQINKSEKEKLDPNEVPFSLRFGEPDEYGDYDWKICETDCKGWVDPLIHKLPKCFPPSFYSLLSRYAFPEPTRTVVGYNNRLHTGTRKPGGL